MSHFFLCRRNISQASYLQRNSWENLLTAFIISISHFSNPSSLWQHSSFRDCVICTWGGVEGGIHLAIQVTDVIIQGLMGKAVTSIREAGQAPS